MFANALGVKHILMRCWKRYRMTWSQAPRYSFNDKLNDQGMDTSVMNLGECTIPRTVCAATNFGQLVAFFLMVSLQIWQRRAETDKADFARTLAVMQTWKARTGRFTATFLNSAHLRSLGFACDNFYTFYTSPFETQRHWATKNTGNFKENTEKQKPHNKRHKRNNIHQSESWV